jgi:hypothetical protein
MVTPLDGPRRAASGSATLRRSAGRSRTAAVRSPIGQTGAATLAVQGAPSTDEIEAILRARLAALNPEPASPGEKAARTVVEVLLECELVPELRADPRFADWVDGALAALDETPAWRVELARLVERLTAGARGPQD